MANDTLLQHWGHKKRYATAVKLEEEHASSKGAATLQLFVARWVNSAVAPYFPERNFKKTFT